MRFILQNGNGDYYAGMGRDRHQCWTASVTADPSEAVLFSMTIENGNVIIEPEAPEDCDVRWSPVYVEVRVRRGQGD